MPPSSLQLYFANLRQEHQVNEIYLVEDKSFSTTLSQDEATIPREASDESDSCEITESSDDWRPIKPTTSSTSSANNPIEQPVRVKYAASTA